MDFQAVSGIYLLLAKWELYKWDQGFTIRRERRGSLSQISLSLTCARPQRNRDNGFSPPEPDGICTVPPSPPNTRDMA